MTASSPYSESYLNLPLDLDDWTAIDFLTYYDINKKLAGKDKARQYVSVDIDQTGWLATIYDSKFNCEMIQQFKDRGLTFPTTLGYAWCGISEISESLLDATTGLAKFIKIVTHPITLGVVGLGAAAYFIGPYVKEWKK